MTKRLYYDDAYTVEFKARVKARFQVEGRPAVVLDQTYFYPTGGGQPYDTGTIGGMNVVDVLTQEGDEVVHVLSGEGADEEVVCRVDWARRFDHMQQHTGQHILTQAFVQIAGINTVGFHLSSDVVTIDLDTPSIAIDKVIEAEDLANQIVFENRTVSARLIDPDKAEGVRIRRIPGQLHTDGLRIIDIDHFDTTACGGTHVSRTGEIGMIKVVKLEKRGDKTRVEFRCGTRALHDYREKNNVLNRLAGDLNTPYWEVEQVIANLREEAKQAGRKLKVLGEQLAEYEVDGLQKQAVEQGNLRLIKAVFAERDVSELRTLAQRLVQTPNTVVLLGTSGEKAQLVFARSSDVPHDMSALLKRVLPILGEARGGGRPESAQGGGVKADNTQVSLVLDEAARVISEVNE
jgi:alanyl-tRNA synthetase